MGRTISFEDIHPIWVTYKHSTLTAADEGKAVTLTGDATVGLGNNGDPVEGKVVKVEAGYCTVEVGTYIQLPYTGSAPALDSKVVVDGAGNVKAYAVDTIANAMKGRGAVKSVDATNLQVTVRLGA